MPHLTYREKVVFLALAYTDGDAAFPSYETLADLCRMKRAQIAETLDALEFKGAITRRRTKTVNVYTLDYSPDRQRNPDAVNCGYRVGKTRNTESAESGPDSQRNADGNRKNRTERTGAGGKRQRLARPPPSPCPGKSPRARRRASRPPVRPLALAGRTARRVNRATPRPRPRTMLGKTPRRF